MAEEGEDQELVGSTNELLFSTNTLVKLVGLTVCGLQMGLGVLCMYSLGWEKTEGFKGGIYFTTGWSSQKPFHAPVPWQSDSQSVRNLRFILRLWHSAIPKCMYRCGSHNLRDICYRGLC